MKSSLVCGCLLAAISAFAAEPTLTPANGYPTFALGADVSWTPYIEQNNVCAFYKSANVNAQNLTTVPEIISDYGIDAVRLRVWVNPTAPLAISGFSFKAWNSNYESMSTFGTCSVQEMTTLAKRFASQGQRIMVVFQMSDQWADPGRQFIPASWADCTTVEQLSTKAVEHVREVLAILRDANVNVAWVQIGNETNNGMLAWQLPATDGAAISTVPYGCQVQNSSQTTSNFVKVFHACADAAKGIYPQTKTILHLTNTTEWSKLNWSLNLIAKAGLSKEKCDYIGLSLYPGLDDGQVDYTAKWQTYADLAIQTIGKISSNYGYRSIIAEFGMNNEYSLSANVSGVSSANLQAAYIAQCNTDVKACTQYLIEKLTTASSTCDGLFYWEPATDYIKGYTRGACVSANPGASWPRNNVTPNDWWKAMKEASTFPDGGLVPYEISGIEDVPVSATPSQYYNLQGLPVSNPSAGVYIQRQGGQAKKVLIR